MVVRRKGEQSTLCYVQKSAGVSLQWRPDPNEFRFLDAVGIVDGVRYVQPKGEKAPMKLLDVRVKQRIISIDESALTKLIPVPDSLRRRSI